MATNNVLSYHDDEATDLSYRHDDLPYVSRATFDTESSPISSPNKAFSMQLPSRLRLPPPSSELTPPPSPPGKEYEHSRRESTASRFAPIINRASSVLSKRQSVSPRQASPVRGVSASPVRSQLRSTLPDYEESASSASISLPNHAGKASKAATAFADFFQGSSELVNGFRMDPKRQDSSYTARSRPGHFRTDSAVSAAANFFGRSSPTKQFRSREQEEEEDMLNLDIDDELFPQGVPTDIGLPDFDELRSNAERLFMRMQMSYQQKVESLNEQKVAHEVQEHDLDAANARAAHLKSQLYIMTQEQDAKIQRLEAELEQARSLRQAEKETRMRSVRLVSKEGKPSLASSGADGHRLFSGDREDGLHSLSEAGFDSGDESGSESGQSWSQPATPSMSRSESPARPGWPGLGTASLMEENLKLKGRIAELEETVDGCLGLVGAL